MAGTEWRKFCRKVEDLGFATLFACDHLGDQVSPVPALAAAAEAATRLRIGTLVTCNDFRHPVVHAKEIATLDLLSGGRVEWGIGAGWFASEYEKAGIEFDPPSVRVDRMQEAVAVMKGLFADGPVTHHGTHYRITALEGGPKPVQRPHPPLLVGGGGRRMLTFAAREAAIVGVAPSQASRRIGEAPAQETVERATDRQVGWIREAAGDRLPHLELQMVVWPAIVTSSPDEPARQWSEHLGLEPAQVLASPHVWMGTIDQICDSLLECRERWDVSYWVVQAADVDVVAPVVARLAGH